MPWKACKPMDERLKFIARLLDGEKMAGLCRQFGISRKTGYKILKRVVRHAWTIALARAAHMRWNVCGRLSSFVHTTYVEGIIRQAMPTAIVPLTTGMKNSAR